MERNAGKFFLVAGQGMLLTLIGAIHRADISLSARAPPLHDAIRGPPNGSVHLHRLTACVDLCCTLALLHPGAASHAPRSYDNQLGEGLVLNENGMTRGDRGRPSATYLRHGVERRKIGRTHGEDRMIHAPVRATNSSPSAKVEPGSDRQ